MNTQANSQTIQRVYEAFGQRNIPGVLALIADNFEWTDPGEGSSDIPYAGHYVGKAGFGVFFQKMNATAEITSFAIKHLQAVDSQVFARGDMSVRSKATGKTGQSDFVMVWNFNGETLVSGRAYLDTNAIANAFRD
jgi:hypothetical protein